MGLKTDPITEVKESLWELEELAISAGCEVIGSITQIVSGWNPATLIGKGKVIEIAETVAETKSSLVVMDHHLSGVQVRNLEETFKVPVIDRHQLILHIFAKRAKSYEGKLQVELAQLLDQMPRLVGAWHQSHSRPGAGIGTKGPGEKALETDRRTMRFRISQIRKELEEVKKHRHLHRESRKRREVPRFALLGYTNTGKSTLLNLLTNSAVLTKNMPFSTLDPTTRKVFLTEFQSALLTDTVGFIRNLPPQLLDAFQATLEETSDADALIHLIDLSSPNRDKQIQVVSELITKFGWDSKPILYVFNKCDVASIAEQMKVSLFPRVFVSALTGEGIENLKKSMVALLDTLKTQFELFFPKLDEHKIYELARDANIIKSEPGSQGTLCLVSMESRNLSSWKEYLIKKNQ